MLTLVTETAQAINNLCTCKKQTVPAQFVFLQVQVHIIVFIIYVYIVCSYYNVPHFTMAKLDGKYWRVHGYGTPTQGKLAKILCYFYYGRCKNIVEML